MPIPNDIVQSLTQLQPDVKAEAIAEQLLLSGISWNEMQFHTDKFFYRNFSKDLYSSKIDDTTSKYDILRLHLSRAGLYDLLPEGLFFQPASTNHLPKSAAEMAEEYRQNKRQEEEIRKFFSPLEHEFFYFRYKNFISEKELLNGFSKGLLNRYFIAFWNLAEDIESSMALGITLLLPYTHRIAGDADLMAECLQSILKEPVQCKLETEWIQQPHHFNNQLGQFELGNQLVCGDTFYEESTCFVFSIENLHASSAADYLPDGKRYSTIQTFYKYFVPINADVRTNIKVKKRKEKMHIGNMEEATLGIATVI